MHHALELDEIVRNIFAHCSSPFSRRGVADLAALARTCRAFEEPALDILWSELDDLTPLVRCLPDASYAKYSRRKPTVWYTFKRPLTQAEWGILRSYTRRVQSVYNFGRGLHVDCVTLLTPPTPEPLFPNLRHLHCTFDKKIIVTSLWHQPFPSLISLHYSFMSEVKYQDPLISFPTFSPNIKKLYVDTCSFWPEVINKLVSDCIYRWSNPETIWCPWVALDVDAVMQLSRLAGLTQLAFELSTGLPDEISSSGAGLLFAKLQELKLYSVSLALVSKLLAHMQLPVITDLFVRTKFHPSKQDFASFLATLHTLGISNCLRVTNLVLGQVDGPPALRCPVLTADDLLPITAFRNLRRINVDTDWKVGLTDDDLLTLVSAWPHLEHLLINERWGWRTSGGITPPGLARLLRTCRSLSRIAIAIDTRGYTEVPPIQPPPASLSPGLLSLFINVIDSEIENASVPAMAAFLANIVPSTDYLLHWKWEGFKCWNNVRARMDEAVAQRFQVSESG